GGIVAKFEKKVANILGKEDAIILPTGTMANVLALNSLAGSGHRVLVQYDSHINRDSGDAAQSLYGMSLSALKTGGLPEVEDVQNALDSFIGEKVDVPVKVLHLESPVRRLHQVAFPLEQFDRITQLAKKKGMYLHLDGARLFIWSVWCGRSVASLASSFDTVYVSLWKYFNSLFGAVLAGSGEVISRLRHQRRRGGGSLAQIWPVALVAGYFMDGFTERLEAAKVKSEKILPELDRLPGISVVSPPNSTNTKLLKWERGNFVDAEIFRKNLKALNVQLPQFAKDDSGFWIKVNETWNSMQGNNIVDAFESALSGKR
ncbi:MAG: threonine aldolase family protein, partial [Desulforhopalus sp.]